MEQAMAIRHGEVPNTLDREGLCLLSLDGGGVRGLSSLYALKAIMDRLNGERSTHGPRKPCHVFDLIGGTSTGGLIAIMLGRLEMDVDECIEAYSELAGAVFGAKLHRLPTNFKGQVHPKFDSKKLENAVKKVIAKTNRPVTELLDNGEKRGCHVFVSATDRYTKRIVPLRSYKLPDQPNVPATICQAALATSAATTFFDEVSIDDRTFADGGFGANNPVNEVEREASNIWCPDSGDLKPLVKCLVSIGTGNPGVKPFADGILGFLSKTMVEIATETENTEAEFIDRWRAHYDGKRYFRFNVEQGLQDVGMDEYNKKGAIKAATEGYLTHRDRIFRVRDCVQNLALKQTRTGPEFEQGLAAHGQDLVMRRRVGNEGRLTARNDSYFGLHSSHDDKTRRDILRALHTSPYLDRKNRNPDRVLGTCEWFTSHCDFKTWRKCPSSAMLWVSANPGCGKSVLAKYLVDELKTTESRTTCYFFFKDDFEDQRSAKSALSCILHQLFTQREDLFSNKILKRFESNRVYLTNSFDELWEVLVMASGHKDAGEIVCILDAFDECEHQERRKLAQALCKFYGAESEAKNNLKLKFLATSRPYDNIRQDFEPLNISGLPVIHLRGESETEISKIAKEIDLYIMDRVSRLQASLHLTPEEESLLLKNLRNNSNQTYLWVYLTLELIESDLSIDKPKIRKIASSLPPTVDDAYERILAKSSNAEKAKKLLHIIVAATRPLTLAEMDLSLALGPEHTSYKDWNRKPEERFGRYIRDLCGLFVNIIESKVYLLHQTAKEFLIPKDGANPPGTCSNQLVWKSSLPAQESHRILFHICTWHLLFTEFTRNTVPGKPHENLHETVSHYLDDHDFLSYSAINWATHFRASGIKDDEAAAKSLRRICDVSFGHCQLWFVVYWVMVHGNLPKGFTTLMIASYFGLEKIVKLLLRIENVNIDDCDENCRRSAVSWASENGFDRVVKLLIKGPKIRVKYIGKLPISRGAKVDMKDVFGQTPLSYAAWNGHLSIVRRLLKAGSSVNVKDEIGGTPLTYALCAGQAEVARELLKGGHADPGDQIQIRRELVLSAASKGHETVVRLLLETADKGDDVNTKDGQGRTPLWAAAAEGHLGVVGLLIEKGANMDAKDKQGKTPLWGAARNGHVAVVTRLLRKGADVNARDKHGKTALWGAATKCHEPVVMLLARGGADMNAKDHYGKTPLWGVVKTGRVGVVRLLIENGADVDAKNRHGETLLLRAASRGHVITARLLLRMGADVKSEDTRGKTPLRWAAANGHGRVLRMLEKGADDSDSDVPCIYCLTRRKQATDRKYLQSHPKSRSNFHLKT